MPNEGVLTASKSALIKAERTTFRDNNIRIIMVAILEFKMADKPNSTQLR